MMYRAALPRRVLQGVQHVAKYSEDLGFGRDSLPGQQLALTTTILESLEGIAELTPENRILLQQHYGTVDQYITTIKWYLSALVEHQEPGFEKLRAN